MSSSEAESSCSITPWIVDFCENIPGNEFFVEVPQDWISDPFNLGHLHQQCPRFAEAYSIIMDFNRLEDFEDEGKESVDRLLRCAELLYGVTHALYINSPDGIKKMIQKWKAATYGKCFGYNCDDQPLLPVGLHYIPNNSMVRVYCPRCEGLFKPHKKIHQDIDGAFFGTEFPHLLFFNYPELRPQPVEKYVPRLWGFKMHPTAVQIQLETAQAPKTKAPVPVNSQPLQSDEPMDEDKTTQNVQQKVDELRDKNVDTQKPDDQKSKSQKGDDQNIDSKNVDTQEGGKVDEGRLKDEPVTEDPVKDDPVKDDPVKDDPVKDDPVKDDPVKDDSVMMDTEEMEVKSEVLQSVSAWLNTADEVEDAASPWQQDEGAQSGGGSSDPIYDCV